LKPAIKMGIKDLNRYFRSVSSNTSIQATHLSQLSGKRIAIDTSIYLYKFSGEGTLMESFYSMITIFRYYNITPLFVFDGKPPKFFRYYKKIKRIKRIKRW
jgi:5'-3' exonuclease